ncbi:DedA family protein [Mediannikoviicoccus vaginalis]|uniref:DedA family protein n=1 Tax=Mediannikoviicoccus vaginalis TaxID=2899727 RepID=UPI001F16392F|nr:DedA family protein [Mediannikoviicoccus vaginalis]
MNQLFLNLTENFGSLGIFLLIFIENIFPPIPSEAVLGIGGLFISKTQLTFVSVLFAATMGSVLGAVALYYIGKYINSPKVRNVFIGKDKLLRVDNNSLSKIKNIYVKHERISVFFLRMVPIFRSIVSIPAGMFGMNLIEFIVLTALGSLIWNAIIIFAGMKLGENWTYIETIIKDYTLVIIALVVIIFIIFFIKRKKEI